jgi:excinuclease ABC subunit A
MADRTIRVRGARTHNLKDVDVDVPHERWTVVCGVSGSGKTSLVLDTLGAESRRRLLGTQGILERAGEAAARPDVDLVDGLPPAVVAGFSSRAPGPRETLGTVTETTHALRALFARAAVPHCPACGRPVVARRKEAVVRDLLARPEGTRVLLLAPRGRGREALADAVKAGFVRVRVEGRGVERVEDVEAEALGAEARLEVVVDRLVVRLEPRSASPRPSSRRSTWAKAWRARSWKRPAPRRSRRRSRDGRSAPWTRSPTRR